jgi:uncharacterized protein YbaP (TraB family)
MKKLFLLTAVCLALGSQALFAQIPITDFNQRPKPGTSAFRATNPHNKNQRILLVPSNHTFPLRFVDKKLQDEMKNSDILIVEPEETVITWNEDLQFQTTLRKYFPSIEELKKKGAVNESPLSLSSSQPWTSALKEADSKKLLSEVFQPILKGNSLDTLHPKFVAIVLGAVMNRKGFNLGMDVQIYRYFTLSNKLIFGLESAEDVKEAGVHKAFDSQTFSSPILLGHVRQLETLVKTYISMGDTSSKPAYEKAIEEYEKTKDNPVLEAITEMGVTQRNELWIPRLLNYFETNKDKSFTIIVGANHFPGPKGILKLLADKGFIIESLTELSAKVGDGI